VIIDYQGFIIWLDFNLVLNSRLDFLIQKWVQNSGCFIDLIWRLISVLVLGFVREIDSWSWLNIVHSSVSWFGQSTRFGNKRIGLKQLVFGARIKRTNYLWFNLVEEIVTGSIRLFSFLFRTGDGKLTLNYMVWFDSVFVNRYRKSVFGLWKTKQLQSEFKSGFPILRWFGPDDPFFASGNIEREHPAKQKPKACLIGSIANKIGFVVSREKKETQMFLWILCWDFERSKETKVISSIISSANHVLVDIRLVLN
jgi:hypothetical protein